MIGHPCDRRLWFELQNIGRRKVPGRISRIFRHGNVIEKMVVDDLRLAGMEVVSDKERLKFSFDYRGKYLLGEMDGVVLSGVPGAPRKKHVLEVKSHNDKSFNDITKNGVKKSKFQHYVQMQIYMHCTGKWGKVIDRAYYVALNKNDDTYYTERIEYDKGVASLYLDRWLHITESTEMPRKLSEDPSWYQCKLCDAWEYCHGGMSA